MSSIWLCDPGTDLTDWRASSYPKKLLLSIMSQCSLHCVHCVRGHFPVAHGTVMARPMLDEVIRDFFPHVSTVWLGGLDLGEQMQSPHFDYVLERARAHPHLDLAMITSGLMLTRARASLMAQSMSQVDLSLEGAGANYTRIRGMRWEAFLQRLEWLTAARDAVPSGARRRFDVIFHVSVMRECQDDYVTLIDLARQFRISRVDFRHFIPLRPDQTAASLLYDPAASDRFFGDLARHAASAGVATTMPRAFGTEESTGARRRKTCHLPFETLGIHADGRITSCCNASFRLGRYQPGQPSVEQVWTGPRYRWLRETVNSTAPAAACARCDSVNEDPRGYRPEFGAVDRVRLRIKGVLPPEVSRIFTRA